MSDYTKILEYCAEHGSITAREAFVHLNINSPRKVISDLRKKGYEVRVEKMDNKGKTPYNKYFISRGETK
jgi:hypothetical protein